MPEGGQSRVTQNRPGVQQVVLGRFPSLTRNPLSTIIGTIMPTMWSQFLACAALGMGLGLCTDAFATPSPMACTTVTIEQTLPLDPRVTGVFLYWFDPTGPGPTNVQRIDVKQAITVDVRAVFPTIAGTVLFVATNYDNDGKESAFSPQATAFCGLPVPRVIVKP